MKPTVLIVGGDSTIGDALIPCVERAGHTVVATTRRETPGSISLDLSSDTWRIPDDVSVAFMLAGETSLQNCEANRAETHNINVTRTIALTRQLVQAGSKIVFISSNLVFDGSVPHRKSEDMTCPTTEYGRQKAETERALLELGATIVRMTKVLSPDKGLLVDWMRALAKAQEIRPFSNVVLAPIPLSFVVELLARVVEYKGGGIIQLSGNEDISYAAAIKHLAQRMGIDETLVVPSVAPHEAMANIPKYTTLDVRALKEWFGLEAP